MNRTPEQSLFESYFVPMLHTAYGTALYLAGNPKDAEELVQEAAVTAFSEFHSFRP